jgi:hypothetical protein
MIKTFTWNAPTARVDGTPLSPSEISYRLYIDGVAIVDFPGSLNPDGSYSFKRDFSHGRYVATITALDSEGRESAQSNEVPFEVISLPVAPSNLSVS